MVQNPRFFWGGFLFLFVSEKESNLLIELNRSQFFWLQLCIHHVLILVMLCTRVSKNGERLNIDCILSVNYAYQFYWCQFFVRIITIIVRILSLTSPFSLLQIFTLNGTKTSSHTARTKTFVHFFLGLKLKIRASEWQHFTVYRSTFVKVVTYFHFSFFCDDVQ